MGRIIAAEALGVPVDGTTMVTMARHATMTPNPTIRDRSMPMARRYQRPSSGRESAGQPCRRLASRSTNSSVWVNVQATACPASSERQASAC